MGVQDNFINGLTGCMNPTFAFPPITAILTGLMIDAGLAGIAIEHFVGCMAGVVFNLFKALIPV